MKVFYQIMVGALALVTYAGTGYAAELSLTATADDKKWLLPDVPPSPADNQPTADRIALGKALFFDPRLSSDSNLSCASCHNPMFGWTDGMPTAKGSKSKILRRASPTIANTGYNTLMMWDGRKSSLEDQAMGPMESMDEMAMDLKALFKWLNTEPTYVSMFGKAYPGEAIDSKSLSKAIAAFERTVVSNNSPFDHWLRGDKNAMTKQQIMGFRVFTDPNKGNCAVCHQAPNFTDGGFHNIGLASYSGETPDMGRYTIKPIPSMKGAFKTPTLRDITLTAPYFHDGSARTLSDVVDHYVQGGATKKDLSPDIKPLNLSQEEKDALVAFMQALTSPQEPVVLPRLPVN